MSSRALSLATVLLLIGFGATDAALAQATNLEAGKAPSQLFTQTCTACHKSPRGLLKSVAPGSLPGFLRQHYTTSSDMAGVLASYLVSNGATDTRYQAKDGKDKKDGVKDKEANTNPAQPPEHRGRRQRSQESVRPEGEGAAPAAEGARQKRAARPAEEGAKEGVKPEGQAAPEGRKGKRRGKPAIEEAPKVDAASPAADDKKNEPKVESKPETAKDDSGESKSESSKPAEKPAEARPESAKVEPRGSDTPALQPDPVPQVTPAAKPAEPAAPKPAEEAAPKPAASSELPAKSQEPAPPATAAAPPAAPAESSGAPTPPISR
ncbi:hypothetical protein IVB38_13440 [Bradyrhizobium sp. 38]|uniref:hypothetical protein n=1 Tax=unclassified Bradyrhizobium TaxID=2631580 RepID=UPI001FF7A64F|nr:MULTISPECIES: hypothetical protein [unclassified Bradyrhizobium]MCK1337000.1 hypothetical protein [Bradyrhizobium sp. 38]MCK1778433.1 hypothetical protein [Bradyrhizobium sp. 132]